MNLTHSRWGRITTLAALILTLALTLLGSVDLSSIGNAP
jgi:hypothetical protein